MRIRLLIVILLSMVSSACPGGGGDTGLESTSTPPASFKQTAAPNISALALSAPPYFAAIRNGQLVWSEGGLSDVKLKKLSLTDGTETPLAVQFSGAVKIVIRGQDIYWSDKGRVAALRPDGTFEVLAKGSVCFNAGDFAIDDSYVYRLASSPRAAFSDSCSITRTALTDGSEITLVDNDWGPIYGLAQDATHIYWTELSRSNSGSDTLSVKRISKNGGTPEALAAGFARFTSGPIVKAGNVYFVDTTNSTADSRILKVPATGGAVVTVAGPLAATASNTGAPHGFDVDLNNVYWIDDQRVRSVSVNGGTIREVATGLDQGVAIAVNGTDVFFIEHLCCTGGLPSRISRVPIAGGPTSVVTDGIFGAHTIVLDPVNIYWGEGRYLSESLGRIAKVALAGGLATTVLGGIATTSPRFAVGDTGTIFVAEGEAVKKVPPEGGPQVETLFWRLGANPGIPATDGSFLYFVENGYYQLLKIPVNGGPETILPSSNIMVSSPVAVKNGFVYWVEQRSPVEPYSINRTPVNGGPIEMIVSGIPPGQATELITDSTNLYWADQYRSTIFKVALSGGPVTTLWPGLFFGYGPKLAQDDSYIYFSNESVVGKVPKTGGQASFYEVLGDAPFAIGVDDTSVYWVTEDAVLRATPK